MFSLELCLSHYVVLQLKYETLRKQDKMAKDKDKSATVPEKGQRYIEAFSSVLQPVTNKIIPLFEPKMWEGLR